MNELPVETIRDNWNYDPITGELTWTPHKAVYGKKTRHLVGSFDGEGYLTVHYRYKKYSLHRLIWVHYYGTQIPAGYIIDHINGNKTDNRIHNLRLYTVRQNQQNRHTHRNGRLYGTSYHTRNNKWQSRFRYEGKLVHIGYYPTEQEAHEAYKQCEQLGNPYEFNKHRKAI